MATGSVTSLGQGHSLWQLRDVEVSRGEEFRAYSPSFSSSGCRYGMGLEKRKDSYLFNATLFRWDVLPLPRLPHRIELMWEEESYASYTITPEGKTWRVSCGVDAGACIQLIAWGNQVLFPSLSVSLRTEGEKKFACCAIQTDVPDSSSRDPDDFANLQTDLEKLVLGERDSDVTLKVRGKSFPAHKVILRVRSPVFDAMFEHDMAEQQSGDVTIEDCDPNTFPDFLHYMYTGSSEKLSEANVCHIFQDADKYGVLRLRACCVEFMKSHLSLETFCDFLALAVRHREGDLVRAATEFFCECGLEILQSVQWQIFLQNNPSVANELLIKAASRWKTA